VVCKPPLFLIDSTPELYYILGGVLDDLAHGKPVRAQEPPKEADHAQG
jgi:hypothetical protein